MSETTSGYEIKQGDALSVLKSMPKESVQMCVTSPPYYGLRSYQTPPVIWDGDELCDHVWGSELRNPKEDKRPVELKIAQGGTVGTNVRSEHWCQGTMGSLCECGAWRGELGLEPTFDCQRDRTMDLELRDDLTAQEKETLIRELMALGLIS